MRVGIWLILMAIVLSIAISCAEKNETAIPGKSPEPSRLITQYVIPDGLKTQTVTEFRASNGNICVFIRSGYSGVLDCSPPLPPLNYEDLPPAEGELK